MATNCGWIGLAAQICWLAGGCGTSTGAAAGTQDATQVDTPAAVDTNGADSAAPTGGDAGTGAAAEASGGVPLGPAPAGLAVHEWATFTAFHTVQGHHYLGGVQRDEEALPAFVHQRQVGPPKSGATETVDAPIVAKVQTAGAFFSAQSAGEFTFKVSVPTGAVVADWPPAAELGPKPLIAGKLGSGSALWRLRVEPIASDPAGDPGALFQPLRKVGAAAVAAVGQPQTAERFLFYRAMATFVPPVRVSATKAAGIANGYDIQVHNDGSQAIARVFLINLHSGGGLLQELNNVPAGGTGTKSATPKEMPELYYGQVKTVLADALQQAGLTAPQSAALVETFTHNWLKTIGLRVIVVAPPQWLATWMPVEIGPAPASHVRVLLGRIELLTAKAESDLLGEVQAAAANNDLSVLKTFGFFAEPTARRMLAVAGSAGLAQFCQALVDAAMQVK